MTDRRGFLGAVVALVAAPFVPAKETSFAQRMVAGYRPGPDSVGYWDVVFGAASLPESGEWDRACVAAERLRALRRAA